MMAMSDDRHALHGEPDDRSSYRKVALALALGFVVLFSLAVGLGAGVALFTGVEKKAAALAVTLTALLAAGAAAWGLVRLKPWSSFEPLAPRTRKARNLIWASAALGAVIGVALSIGTLKSDDPLAMFSNGPLPPAVVLPVLAAWLLLVPAISWQWHRNVDEHEAAAYRFGALAAAYVYIFLTPAWWLAARAGLMPRPDAMLIFVVALIVWSVGWFWRRYR